MESVLLEDPSERFALPQIRETVEGLLDFFTLIGFAPATSTEVDKIAKPSATLLARKPQLQNTVKKFSAPGVLLGALGMYFVPRVLALRARMQAPIAPAPRVAPAPVSTSAPAPQPQPQPSTIAQPSGAANVGAATPPPAPTPPAPVEVQRAAAIAANTIEALRAGMPS